MYKQSELKLSRKFGMFMRFFRFKLVLENRYVSAIFCFKPVSRKMFLNNCLQKYIMIPYEPYNFFYFKLKLLRTKVAFFWIHII